MWRLTIKQPSLGILLLISREINNMQVDVDKLSKFGIAEGMQMVEKYAKKCMQNHCFCCIKQQGENSTIWRLIFSLFAQACETISAVSDHVLYVAA